MSSEPQNSLRIFLCHSSDDKNVVRKIYNLLLQEGTQPWLDEERLAGGEDWELKIKKEIRASHVVVVCLSKGLITKVGFVQEEIKYALDVADEIDEESLFLIPLKLEPCEIPEQMRRLHWVDYYDERGYERLIIALKSRADTLGIPFASPFAKPTDSEELSMSAEQIVERIVDDRLVWVLGGSANKCEHLSGVSTQETPNPPTKSEIALQLTRRCNLSGVKTDDLAIISQNIVNRFGMERLYAELREILNKEYSPTSVHQFLARIPDIMQKVGYFKRHRDPFRNFPFIVTMNFDDTLERAFKTVGNPFDVVSYIKDKFWHITPEEQAIEIKAPNEYTGLQHGRTIILKLYGGLIQHDPEHIKTVITEDDFVKFTARNFQDLLPPNLRHKIRDSNLLLIGFSPKEHGVRQILHVILEYRFQPWAVQWNAEEEEMDFWRRRHIKPLNVPLDNYFQLLTEHVQSWMKNT